MRQILFLITCLAIASSSWAAESSDSVRVVIKSLPHTVIKCDGVQRGITCATWMQPVGECEIEVSLDGFRPSKRTFTLTSDQPLDVTLYPVPNFGTVEVNSNPPEAEVWVDGEKFGTTPMTLNGVLAVEHDIKLTKPRWADYRTKLKVDSGGMHKVYNVMIPGQIVNIEADPKLKVFIDDKFVECGSFSTALSFGEHTAYVTKGDKKGKVNTFTVVEGVPNSKITLDFDDLRFNVNGVSFTMRPVDCGEFKMGAYGRLGKNSTSDEKPVHPVALDTYFIGATEVTQELWEAVMGNNPSFFKDPAKPVEQVSWNDCLEFINKLNELTGEKFRLPTEAEWEFAARGGNLSNEFRYAGADEIDNMAWYSGNSESQTQPVASKWPNELGLYDMSGNVWEWCSDFFGRYTASLLPIENPLGAETGTMHVRRGGSWNNTPRDCRPTFRDVSSPDFKDFNIGLRLALSE